VLRPRRPAGRQRGRAVGQAAGARQTAAGRFRTCRRRRQQEPHGTGEGCAAYRKKNAGRPLDEFDPSRDIQVTRRFERYDAEGNLIDEPGIGEYRCPRLPRKPR
jgi:hypothetical protein